MGEPGERTMQRESHSGAMKAATSATFSDSGTTTSKKVHPPVAIVGMGALGRTLALALHHLGIQNLVGYTRDASAIEPVPFTLREGLPNAIDSGGCWVILTLPDDQIPSVASRLAEEIEAAEAKAADKAHPAADAQGAPAPQTPDAPAPQTPAPPFAGVIHTSGAHSSELLSPLKAIGIPVASIHPLQSFPQVLKQSTSGELAAQRFLDLPVSVEGNDALSHNLTGFLRDVLKAAPFPINASQKSALHAAAVFASNALVPPLASARRLLQDAGLDQGLSLLEPLILQTLWNTDEQGEKALSGPILRGDVHTIKSHLEMIKHRPALLRHYVASAGMILDLLPLVKKNSEPWQSIRKLLSEFMAEQSR